MFKKFVNLISDPATRLVWSRKLASAVIVLVAIASTLVGISIAVLNLYVVPRVSDWRPDLERISSEYLGSVVRINEIDVDSSQIIPSFKILGLSIQTSNEHGELEELSLPLIKLDVSFGSLIGLSFEKITLDNPLLTFIRSSNGQVRVAGLPVNSTGNGKALDWFFSQPNIQVQHATALWQDERLTNEFIKFEDVELYFANGLKSHAIKLEASPPKEIGDRFNIQANFKESLLSNHASNFKEWSGSSLFNFTHIDLALVNGYLPEHPAWNLQEGSGWIRIWIDLHHGAIDQITTDLNFPNLIGSWSTKNSGAQKIQLKELRGRFQVNLKELTNEFGVQDLNFLSDDGNHWSIGRAFISWTRDSREVQEDTSTTNDFVKMMPMQSTGSGAIEIDKVSIKPIINQLNNLQIGTELSQYFKNIEFAGNLQNFKMTWDFDGQKTTAYNLQGQLSSFDFVRLPDADENFLKGIPGVQNAGIKFSFNNRGGNASLTIDNGAMTLPQLLEEPLVPITHANADVQWTLDEKLINLKINKTNIFNADARGDFELNWSIPRRVNGPLKEEKNNSIIDLTINIQQGVANQVYRYLPKKVDAKIRQYLQKAITQGTIKNGSIKIKGPLNKFPFVDPGDGEFHVLTQLQDATFQYAPVDGVDSKLPLQSKSWPELTHLNSELVIDRKSLFFKKASTKLNSTIAPSLDLTDISADIIDLYKPIVNVKAKGKGPLGELIKIINTSAVGELLDNSLLKAESSGSISSDYALNLSLPLNDLVHSKVAGSIEFSNNDLTLLPGLPSLSRLRGSLNFNESGFVLNNVKARILGSEAKIEGGLKFTSDKDESTKLEATTIKVQGVVSAEGLRQTKEIPVIAKVGQYLSGQSNFVATLSFKKGQLDFQLNSSLQGLSSQLPSPLGKNIDAILPLKIGANVIASSSQITKGISTGATSSARIVRTNVTLGQIALASIITDFANSNAKSTNSAFVSTSITNRGWIGINTSGSFTVPSNLDPGYLVNVDVPKIDADIWEKVLTNISSRSDVRGVKKDGGVTLTSLVSAVSIPIALKIKTSELIFSARSIHQVALDAVYQDIQPSGQWHFNINSTEAKGAIDYKLANPGSSPKIFARMSVLVIPPSALDSVESLLNNKDTVMPALDVVVEDMEIKGKKLGRAEIEAINQPQLDGGREWRINKLNLTVPEAKFQASGVWTITKDNSKNQNVKKITLDFFLDIENSGNLLDRLGTKGVVAAGKGKLSGQVSWFGAPTQIDYPSLGGHFNVNIEKGSFLKTEPGAGRLLGVLNLQALPRRLLLDFKDIFSEGFSFDFFRGDVSIESGIAKTNNLQMKSVNAAVLMEGRADISNETQNLKVIVIPEIDAGTASLVVAAINPVIGISTYLAQYFLKKPIAHATTKDFLVEGTWSDPKVTKIEPKLEIKNDNKTNNKP